MKTPLFRRPHRDQNAAALLFLVVTIIVGFAALARADEPLELGVMRDLHEKKVAAAIRPLDIEYVKRLKILHKRYASAQKVDAGKLQAIVAEIDRVERKHSIVGRWHWATGGVLTVKSDGTARHSTWSKPGVWRNLGSGMYRLDSPYKKTFVLWFKSPDSALVQGMGGKETSIKRLSKKLADN